MTKKKTVKNSKPPRDYTLVPVQDESDTDFFSTTLPKIFLDPNDPRKFVNVAISSSKGDNNKLLHLISKKLK